MEQVSNDFGTCSFICISEESDAHRNAAFQGAYDDRPIEDPKGPRWGGEA